MPITPRQRQTGNSTIDELIKFLGGDDPAQSMMDTINPAVGMARKAAGKLVPPHVQRSIRESMSETVFDVAKRFEDEIAMLKSKIDALDATGGGSVRQRFELKDKEKALANMKGELPPPEKLHPTEVRPDNEINGRSIFKSDEVGGILEGEIEDLDLLKKSFETGRRPIDNPNATLADVLREAQDNSIFMTFP